jgi:hypothetical protein
LKGYFMAQRPEKGVSERSSMNFGDWTVKIAPHDEKNPAAQVFVDALYAFFSLFPFKAVEHAESADLIPESPGRLIVIPSAGKEIVREYFKCLLSCAYGSRKETGMSDHRYLFIDLGRPSILFEGLMRPLTHCNIARKSKIYSLLPEIDKLLFIDPKPISSLYLRQAIECTTFPSGAEEMQEIYFRDVSLYHNLFRELESHIMRKVGITAETDEKKQSEVKKRLEEELPAVRLLLGALAAGDIEHDGVEKTLLRMGINIKGAELKNHFSHLNKERKDMKLDSPCLAALSKYLKGRRILVVEDRLKQQYWNLVIPILFGAPKQELKNDIIGEQKIGNVLVSYAKNMDAVLQEGDNFQDELRKYDIILLDLYSSETNARASSGHMQADIEYSITKFFERLARLRDQPRQKDIVPVSSPRVVIFSADCSGLTARTMLKKLGASDYFFKTPDAESHKSEYYATFRNALINALKENVTEVLSLPQSSAKKLLDEWLGQIRPADRSMILRIMKHFRYYSAKSIIRAFDGLFDLPGMSKTRPYSSNGRGYTSLLGSSYLEPRKYIFAGLGRANKSGPATLVLLSKSQWNKNLNSIPELKGYKEIKDRHPTFTSYEDLPSAILKEFDANKNQNIPVILVDDFIGSGGQVCDYVKKAAEYIISKSPPEIYDAIKNAFESSYSGPRVELHVLFAIGLLSEPLLGKAKLRRIEKNKNSFSGLMKTTLCRKPNEDLNGIEEDKKCECDNEDLVFKVHIADAISDLNCLCSKKGISFQKIEKILQGYTCITRARANEFPCQFEPLGWKHCGGLMATYANAQGNTLPIIWGEGIEEVREWKPLFPRFFNPWTDGKTEGKKDNCSGNPGDCDLLVGVPKDLWPEKAKNDGDYRIGPDDTRCWIKIIK